MMPLLPVYRSLSSALSLSYSSAPLLTPFLSASDATAVDLLPLLGGAAHVQRPLHADRPGRGLRRRPADAAEPRARRPLPAGGYAPPHLSPLAPVPLIPSFLLPSLLTSLLPSLLPSLLAPRLLSLFPSLLPSTPAGGRGRPRRGAGGAPGLHPRRDATDAQHRRQGVRGRRGARKPPPRLRRPPTLPADQTHLICCRLPLLTCCARLVPG